MVVLTAGIRPNVGLGVVSGLTVERAIVTDDQMRSVDDPDIYAVGECAQHRGEVYGLVAPLWEQAVVLADHVTGVNPKAAYHGSRIATKLKVAGVDVAVDGGQGARAAGRRVRPLRRAQARRLQVGRHPRRQADRRDAARRHQEGRVPAPRASTAGCRCPRSASSCCSSSPGRPRSRARPRWTTRCRSATATACPRATSSRACAAGEHSVTGCMNATRAGKGCGACKPLVKRHRRVGRRPRAAARSASTRARTGTSPRSRWTSPR